MARELTDVDFSSGYLRAAPDYLFKDKSVAAAETYVSDPVFIGNTQGRIELIAELSTAFDFTGNLTVSFSRSATSGGTYETVASVVLTADKAVGTILSWMPGDGAAEKPYVKATIVSASADNTGAVSVFPRLVG